MMTTYIDEIITSDIIEILHKGIKEELHSPNDDVNETIDHVLVAHGKAVRPAFMALVAQFAGGTWDSVMKAAIVIESIHVSSLLHDDVIDGSDTRRGVVTLNAKYSDKISVLTGDYIFIKAVMLCHKFEDSRATSIILQAVERMIRGEIRDSLVTGVINEETYISIAADKTASLFAAAGELGIMLSGGTENEILRGRSIGEYIGTAFQIVDDTLDYKGDSQVMGKPGLMDAIAGRMTLPLIYSLRQYNPEKIKEIISGGRSSAQKLSALVSSNGGIEYALGYARNYLDKALEVSEQFGNMDAQSSLKNFIRALIDRHY